MRPKPITAYAIPLLIGVLLCIIALEAVALLYFRVGPEAFFKKTLSAYAGEMVAACANARHRPSCYDKVIPKLMDTISMEEAFEVTRLVQEKDGEYWYCHVLGHELSAQETAKDTARWKDVVARCPSGMCSNGCLHGAFQERFRTDALPDVPIAELKPELEGICNKRGNWEPTGLERATCTHALGHLTMYITGADVRKATDFCDELDLGRGTSNDLTQLCYDGAFMQIFQPLDPEDIALVKGKEPKKNELQSFCGSYTGQKRGSCWNEGWPLYIEEIKTPKGLVRFCGELSDDPSEYTRCFHAMFYVLTAQFNFDEKKIIAFCNGLPKERQGTCFANAASRLIETDWRLVDRSIVLCTAAAALGVERVCYDELLFYSRYNFKKDTPEFMHLCERLPEQWKERCASGE